MDKIYLSKEGYQKYLEELENIKKKIEKNNIDIRLVVILKVI